MDPAPPPASSPECPRCGYDLSGAVALWKDACDLQGTCSECGLAFDWRDILDPIRRMPRWFLENPRRWFLRTLIPNTLLTLLPWNFWKRVNLAYPLFRRRLICFVLLMLLCCHFAVGFFEMREFRVTIAPSRYGPRATLTVPDAQLNAFKILVWPYTKRIHHATMTVLPPPPPPPPPGAPAGPAQPPFIYPFIFETQAYLPFAAPALALVLVPVSYLILGGTFRKARVRYAHLVRIGAYSTPLLLPLITLMVLETISANRGWTPMASTFDRWLLQLASFFAERSGALIGAGVVLPLLWIYWYFATKRYLKLPHALGVSFAMCLIAALIVFLLFTVMDPGRIFNI